MNYYKKYIWKILFEFYLNLLCSGYQRSSIDNKKLLKIIYFGTVKESFGRTE